MPQLMQMGKGWFWVDQETGKFTEKNMKVISKKLQNAKHDQFDKGDIEYFRMKTYRMKSADLLRIQEMFIKVIKKYGGKVSTENYLALVQMEGMCERALKQKGAPMELTRDSFRNKKFDERSLF